MTKRLADMTDAEKVNYYEYQRHHKENVTEEEKESHREYQLCLSCNSKKGAQYIDYRPDSYWADWT